MVKARTLVLRGLMEALVLDSLYREPKHGYGLIKELEQAVGALPGKNQVYPLLTRLETDGLITSREETGEGGRPRLVYALTHKGEKRLTEYKAIPPVFRERLFHLWGHGHGPPLLAQPEATGEEDAEDLPRTLDDPAPPQARAAPHRTHAPPETGWVEDLLARLPPGTRIGCPHAEVELRREPGSGGWTIQARRASIAAHEGHAECALCFVVRAAVRLLFSG